MKPPNAHVEPATPARARRWAGAPALVAIAVLAAIGAIATPPSAAIAGEHPRGPLVPVPAHVQQECGACHVVFPPRLLPAASWQRLLGDLHHHFGTDASLDTAAAQEIERWLVAEAAGVRGVAGVRRASRDVSPPPEDRITRSAWFLREHREVGRATWALPAVKNPSNCLACHTRADEGNFDERHIRIPR